MPIHGGEFGFASDFRSASVTGFGADEPCLAVRQTGGDYTLTSLKWWLIYMNWELRYEIFYASPTALEQIKGIYYGKLKSVELD